MTRIPEQKFLVIRRGPVLWEVKFREQSDSRFRTTKIPVMPLCQRPARCKYCDGIRVQGTLIVAPLIADEKSAYHKITPQLASHLVAFEWGSQHPNQPFTVAWLLTDEEKEAGKKGIPESQIP